MTSRSRAIACSSALALTLATTTAVRAVGHDGPWDGTPGAFPVRRTDSVTLHDAARAKDLVAAVEVPQGTGPFPLIVFSHGYGGSKDGYTSLTSFWASHGYVVVQPDHADARALRSLRDLLDIRDIWKRERPPQWRARVADVALVIASLDALERSVPGLTGRIDRSRIGVGGHSYGALTTELVAGTRSHVESPALDLRLRQVTAALAMSPEGTSADLGFTTDSWSDITVPMMFMTGSEDRGAGGQPGSWRREPYAYSPPGGRQLVFIEGARHLSFSGRGVEVGERGGAGRGGLRRGGGRLGGRLAGRLAGADDPEREASIFAWVQAASLAFWDETLGGSTAARAFLASDALSRRSGGAVEVASK